MTSNEVKETKNSEIDLIDVLSRLWKGFYKTVCIVVIFLIRKSLWLLGFAILGCGVAFLCHHISKRHYTSTMMAQVNVLSNAYVADYINHLGEIKDTLTRAEALNVPVSAAKHIIDINAFLGVDTDGDKIPDYIDVDRSFQFNSHDTIKKIVPKIFYVRVRVSKKDAFFPVSQSVVDALKNNPYLIQWNEMRIARLQETISDYERQYQRLDSLEQFEYFNKERLTLKTSGQIFVVSEKERQLYHKPLLDIRKSILAYKEELAMCSEPITIIRNFSALNVADNPLGPYIERWVLIFLAIGLIFLVIRQNRTKIWRLISDKQY
jgi:hypothetical protein